MQFTDGLEFSSPTTYIGCPQRGSDGGAGGVGVTDSHLPRLRRLSVSEGCCQQVGPSDGSSAPSPYGFELQRCHQQQSNITSTETRALLYHPVFSFFFHCAKERL